MDFLDFAHDFHKLRLDRFFTVRGRSRFDRLKRRDRVELRLRGERLCVAQVEHIALVKLSDIRLDWLEFDSWHGSWKIKTHLDFLGFINSMRKFKSAKLGSVEEYVSLIFLEKMTGDWTPMMRSRPCGKGADFYQKLICPKSTRESDRYMAILDKK